MAKNRGTNGREGKKKTEEEGEREKQGRRFSPVLSRSWSSADSLPRHRSPRFFHLCPEVSNARWWKGEASTGIRRGGSVIIVPSFTFLLLVFFHLPLPACRLNLGTLLAFSWPYLAIFFLSFISFSLFSPSLHLPAPSFIVVLGSSNDSLGSGEKKKNKKRGIHYFNREKLRQRLDVDDDDDDYDEKEKERGIEITLLANVIDLRRSTLVRAVNFLFASFFLSFFLSLFDFRYRRVRRNSTHEFITVDLRLRHFRVYTPRFLFPEIFSTLFRFSLLSERFVIAWKIVREAVYAERIARVWSSGAGAPQREEKKFKVEGSVARYSSTFGSGCQGALFTGFAAERTINSTTMQVVNARQRPNLRLSCPRKSVSRLPRSFKGIYRFNSRTMIR